MKLILVAAGYNYYPCDGDGDWIKCFETMSEAQKYVDNARSNAEDRSCTYYFKDKCVSAEWVRFIDLREWIYAD